MKNEKPLWKDLKLHGIVLGLTVLTEFIGTHRIPLGPGVIMLFPMLYAMILGLILFLTKVVNEEQAHTAEPIIIISITLLIAKIGVLMGPSLEKIIQAGPALLLQEFGNLGTIFFALPLALILGFKREAVGMTHSIGREPNVGLIMDKYGFNSPEGRGVMMVYIVGTLFGTVFLGLIAGFLASATPLHPLAFAMATGVGSGSLMSAASGALTNVFPEMADDILAFAGASNLLSTATGLYMSIFVALPLTNKLYSLLEPKLGRLGKNKGKDESAGEGGVPL
ncbi:DUF3100 domain-containing protein [Geosporobacter ferrireducens]|uniref:DUF3100 domain-containing protein n=1 Tax=Geosporobacter ferrireducens TaxID=1424294 RepID=UPI00139C14B4|nr:DUF3100 domain-containing protein [Geosporobacter ferrireducens]MTI54431.1 DUF3100 domain-containing protein [Geosporobacter ferrireducens]